jgi:YfiH family protein
VSAGPFATANLGTRNGDAPDAVATNRRRLADALQLDEPAGWCWLRQVHGTSVLDADAAAEPDAPSDAAVTRTAGRPLTVLTADCAPVVLACDDAAAVAHAGWTGLLAGVLEAAVTRLRAVGHGRVRAALGPCIHPARYEFGSEDLARLVDAYGPTLAGTTHDGHPALDLPAGVRAALARVDVTDLEDVDVCTAASPDHFSYRRDGETGRQALVALLE